MGRLGSLWHLALAVILGVTATIAAVAVPVPGARAVTSPSGELVIIDSVTVGNNLVIDACGTNGLVTATCTATACTVTMPPGGAGSVDVRVTTAGGTSAGGTSATSRADRYTYKHL